MKSSCVCHWHLRLDRLTVDMQLSTRPPGALWQRNECSSASPTSLVSAAAPSEELTRAANGTEEPDGRSSSTLVLATCISVTYCLICAVALVGNLLVMYGVIRYTKMKTATNIYIFNLALADALAAITLPFQSAKYILSMWPFGEALCKVVISIDYYNMLTSVFTLTMMSVDRYIAVCHPVRALDFRTPAKAKVINVCIWLLASTVAVPVMVKATLKVNHKGLNTCKLQFPEPEHYWNKLMRIILFVFTYVVPVLIISVCYSLMVLRLKSVRTLSGSKEKDRNMRRITRMVLVIVVVFILCWSPIQFFIIIRMVVTIDLRNLAVVACWHLCVALGYINSSLNPILYALMDENFKRCFRDLCLPYHSRLEQSSLTRARNSTREPMTVCAPAQTEGPLT